MRRLEKFVADAARPAFSSLARLKGAAEGDGLTGLARGLAYQLVEAAGALPRREAEEYVRALYRAERKALRLLGVRFGAFSVYVEDLAAPETLWIREIFAQLAAPGWRPVATLAVLPREKLAPEALSFRGLRAVGGVAAAIVALERIGEIARDAGNEGFALSRDILAELGWGSSDAERVLRGLGFAQVRENGTSRWRRKTPRLGPAAAVEPSAPTSTAVGAPCRIDVWLWRARFCKTRALAAKHISDGEIVLTRQGERTVLDKPSRQIRPGDALTLSFDGRTTALRIEAIGERRGPAAEARGLYSLLSNAGA